MVCMGGGGLTGKAGEERWWETSTGEGRGGDGERTPRLSFAIERGGCQQA